MATRIKPSEIKHGDIVTFTKDDGQKYLSRVIGLPGDNIEIIEDIASVNGEMEIWIEEGNQIKDQFELKNLTEATLKVKDDGLFEADLERIIDTVIENVILK